MFLVGQLAFVAGKLVDGLNMRNTSVSVLFFCSDVDCCPLGVFMLNGKRFIPSTVELSPHYSEGTRVWITGA